MCQWLYKEKNFKKQNHITMCFLALQSSLGIPNYKGDTNIENQTLTS